MKSVKIYVKKISAKHRGMFAGVNIRKGEVIERCPVIVIPLKDKELLDKTHVYDYYFNWGSRNQPAIVLGYGSIYNHSYEPNADYNQDTKNREMVFKAIRDIRKDEEIRTNYNGEPKDQSELWFRTKDDF
jgi:uncharacterized protein